MPNVLTCPNGHRWEINDTEPTAAPALGQTRCPVCGEQALTTPPSPMGTTGAGAETSREPEAPTLTPRLTRVDGYEILEPLGRGGMGVVYRARQRALNRQVALKMLLAGLHAGPEELARFRAEAEAAARLRHPNIVQVYEFGEEGGHPYFSMELVEGGDLRRKLQGRPWPPREAARLIEQLARAMQVAHERGIVHRDLKPANILLQQKSEGSGQGSGEAESLSGFTPKITDFGLAKLMDVELSHTRSGIVMGTPGYMAPEQAAGRTREIGPGVDIYALGAILYELLTGRPPFEGATILRIVQKVVTTDPAPPRRYQPQLPLDLQTICLKCLEKDPRGRYQTAEELADELRRFLRGEAIRARPLLPLVRGWRWLHRNLVFCMLVTAAVLALFTGVALVASELSADRERAAVARHRQEAESQRQIADEQSRQVRRARYAADLKLAYQAWKDADLLLLRNLLARYLPQPGEDDLRGWEWYYLWGLDRHDRVTLRGHTGDVYRVEFSPDGRKLATASKDRTVRLWNAAGRLLATLEGHTDEVNWVTFSPNGRLLASCGDDRTIRVWDVEAVGEGGAPAARLTLVGHTDCVVAVAFAPDGATLASGGRDKLVKVWDVTTGKERLTLRGHTDRIESLAFSPDGKTVATAGRDDAVRLWDLATGKEGAVWRGKNRPFCVAFSADGRTLSTSWGDGWVRFWDVQAGRERAAFFKGEGVDRTVQTVALAPGGRVGASGGNARSVRVWDVASGKDLAVFKGHPGRVWCVAFAPDGRVVASAGEDGTVHLWRPDQPQGPKLLHEGQDPVHVLQFSPDGKTLAVGSEFRVRLWDLGTGRPGGDLVHPQPVASVSFSPGGETLAVGVRSGLVRLWDVPTGRLLDDLPGPPRAFDCCVAFSPDGRALAVGCRSTDADNFRGGARVWEVATRQPGKEFERPGEGGGVVGLAWSLDGQTLALGLCRSEVVLWNPTKDTERTIVAGWAHWLSHTPDGRTLLAGGRGGTLDLWDVATGQLQARHIGGRSDTPGFAALSPDGRSLATATRDARLELWSVPAWQELSSPDEGGGPVHLVAFSPDGRTLATAGRTAEGTSAVYLWSAAPREAPAQAPR